MYIYICHVLGNQTSWYSDFCFQHSWDFARRAKDVLTKPPEKNKAPYIQFLKVSNLHLAKKKSNPWLKRAKFLMGIWPWDTLLSLIKQWQGFELLRTPTNLVFWGACLLPNMNLQLANYSPKKHGGLQSHMQLLQRSQLHHKIRAPEQLFSKRSFFEITAVCWILLLFIIWNYIYVYMCMYYVFCSWFCLGPILYLPKANAANNMVVAIFRWRFAPFIHCYLISH